MFDKHLCDVYNNHIIWQNSVFKNRIQFEFQKESTQWYFYELYNLILLKAVNKIKQIMETGFAQRS